MEACGPFPSVPPPPPPPRTCFSSTYDVAGQGQTPRTPHRPVEKVGRKSVPGFGQGAVCRTATKSKHCPRRKYTLSVLLSNKGVNEKSLSQLMTSGEHGQRYQLPSTGAPGRKKNLVFSIPLGEVFNKFAKKKSDCLFISVVINLPPNARAMVSFHANFWRTEAWLCPILPLRGHSVSHILLLSKLFVGPLKENKEEAR